MFVLFVLLATYTLYRCCSRPCTATATATTQDEDKEEEAATMAPEGEEVSDTRQSEVSI